MPLGANWQPNWVTSSGAFSIFEFFVAELERICGGFRDAGMMHDRMPCEPAAHCLCEWDNYESIVYRRDDLKGCGEIPHVSTVKITLGGAQLARKPRKV